MHSSEFVHFLAWFGNSVVVDDFGWPLTVYHGSTEDIQYFDKNKIRPDDLDAPFNGFWFSENSDTQPAMRAARYTKSYFLSLQNPAPWRAWRAAARRVAKGVQWPANARSQGDAVRLLLQDEGYDGVVWEDRPTLDMDQWERNGRIDFEDTRGYKHALVWDQETEGVDLYDVGGSVDHHVTGYESIQDYLDMITRVFVVFEPGQITRV